MKNNSLKLRFLPKIWLVVVFYIILILTMYLLLSKNIKKYRLLSPPFNTNDFYSHISNFIISYNIVSIISLIWLLQGASLRFIIALCIIGMLINVIVELFVTILNTPDVIDAGYGTAGIVLAFIFGLVAKKFGLKDYKQTSQQKF